MPITTYLHKMIVRPFSSANPDEGRPHFQRLLATVYTRFQQDPKLFFFSYRILEKVKDSDDEQSLQIIMDHLRFDGNTLFGTIGIAKTTFDNLVRQRDPVTMAQTDLATSSPSNLYEYYTFFAVSALSHMMLILRNTDMPSYSHKSVATILSIALNGEPFEFEIDTYQETTIKQRIKEMKESELTIVLDAGDIALAPRPSIKRIEQAASHRGRYTMSYRLKYTYSITDEIIDDLITLKEEGGIRTLIIKEDKPSSESPDQIDLLKDILKEKRILPLTKEQSKNVDLVHQHMLRVLNPPTE